LLRRLAYLAPYFLRYRRKLVWGLLAIAASVAVGLANPLLVGHTVDSLRQHVSSAVLLRYAALILGVALVQGIFSYTQRMVLVGMSRDIEFDLRNDYFASLERQAPAFFAEHPTGDLMARATNDLQAVRMICGPAIMYSFNTLMTATGALFFMTRISGRLTLLAVLTMPLVALVTQLFGARIHSLFEGVQERFSDLSAVVQENLAGVRVVRAYAQEESEKERFREINQIYVDQSRRLIGWSVSFYPLLQGIIGVAAAAVLWYGGGLVLRGTISLGQFVTFNFFLSRLVWPMIALGWVINLTQRGAASLGRMQSVLEAKPEITDEAPLTMPASGTIAGAVALDHLTFAYSPQRPPALEDVEIAVPAGQTVAIVGRTGAGKSTLLSLLPRLWDPPSGKLTVDGVDVRHLPLRELRGSIGMVPQETFLFSATIRENVALGVPEATEQEIATAAQLAGLEPDLAAFPQGLDTVVGERGLTLSGGQKQRVALARALLRHPRMLLLDDCLSAVDTQTEETILGHLRRVFVGRTVFLVSHRVSTVKDANRIVVLDHGRVAEQGTHAELIAAGGLYADLHQRQLLEEELAAV
jgi:ATP-binding cassette subfamily B multidrug efflux pump